MEGADAETHFHPSRAKAAWRGRRDRVFASRLLALPTDPRVVVHSVSLVAGVRRPSPREPPSADRARTFAQGPRGINPTMLHMALHGVIGHSTHTSYAADRCSRRSASCGLCSSWGPSSA